MADSLMPRTKRSGLYHQAVLKMKENELSVSFPPKDNNRPSLDFEAEFIEMAAWLEVQFEEFEKLQSTSAEICKGSMLDDLLERIYHVFQNVIPYDRIGCALLSEDSDKTIARWAKSNYDNQEGIQHGFSAKILGSSLQTVLNDRQPRIINDLREYLRQNPDSLPTKLIVAEGIQSSLTCPLIAEDKPIGFLFFSSKEKNSYHNAHQIVFIHLASQVSALIEKSQLYQRIFSLNQKLTEAMAQLKDQSCRDSLTGVFHRGAITEFMHQRLHEGNRKKQPVSIILADLDHFKLINDTYGHVAGDNVLRQTTRVIQRQLRDYDNVGRYGGEEFLIVLGDTCLSEAKVIAERIRNSLEQIRFEHSKGAFSVTTSIGIACTDCLQPVDEESFFQLADTALYQAKRQGRNQIAHA